jgi:hypothetical protein
MRFSIPSTASLGQAPYEVGCHLPPRFRSQVFSTSQRFPSKPELRSLVSCCNRSWDSPFRAFPSQKSRYPSRGCLLPCRCPPTCKDALSSALLPLVSPTSTPLTQLPGSSSDYGSPFDCQIDHFPVALDPKQRVASFRQLHRLRSFFPPANPFASTEVALTRRPLLSWVPRPPELPLPRLGACPRPSPKTRTPTRPRRVGSATQRTSQPSAPGETSPTPKCRADLVGGNRPPSRPTAPPLSDAPTPSTFFPSFGPKPSRRSRVPGAF